MFGMRCNNDRIDIMGYGDIKMTDWEKYWTRNPKLVGEKEYLNQAEHTVNGLPYSDCQFQPMVLEICNCLDLRMEDVLLDVCCGNGVITTELAKKCRKVIGVDFSKPMLKVANQDHRPANVNYHRINVIDFEKISKISYSTFNKILMYGSLQYFRKRELTILLNNILQLSADRRTIFIGSIPDKKRKWKFYRTPQKKLLYLYYKMSGKDAIGTWWDRRWIETTCERLGLQCNFQEHSIDKPVASWRFDMTLY